MTVNRSISNDSLIISCSNNDIHSLRQFNCYVKSDINLNLIIDLSAFKDIDIMLFDIILESFLLRKKYNKTTTIYANSKVYKFLNLIYLSNFIHVVCKDNN